MTAPISTATPVVAEGGIVPTELDILCGKTKQIINHPGTIRYQRILENYTQRYIQADSKFDKMKVTRALYEDLKTTSRFLKFNEKEQAWEEITQLAARDKVGHALRFAVKNQTVSDTKKKRMKGKRHRRAGSDFSLTSIASEVSVNSEQGFPTQGLVPLQEGKQHRYAATLDPSMLSSVMQNISSIGLQEPHATTSEQHPFSMAPSKTKNPSPEPNNPPFFNLTIKGHATTDRNTTTENDFYPLRANTVTSSATTEQPQQRNSGSNSPLDALFMLDMVDNNNSELAPYKPPQDDLPPLREVFATIDEGEQQQQQNFNFLSMLQDEGEEQQQQQQQQSQQNTNFLSMLQDEGEQQQPQQQQQQQQQNLDFLSMLQEPIYEIDMDPNDNLDPDDVDLY